MKNFLCMLPILGLTSCSDVSENPFLWISLGFLMLFIFVGSKKSPKRQKEEEETRKRRDEIAKHFEGMDKQFQSSTQVKAEVDTVISHINFSVKGTIYRTQKEIAAARMCDVGNTLILQTESDNKQDEFAVKVFTIDGFHIGYVEKQYSKIIASKINYISRCRISKITFSDVPYIFADVYFSDKEQIQPKFKPKEMRISPTNRLINPLQKQQSKYERTFAFISWTKFLPSDSQVILNELSQGDELQLKHNPISNIPYCVDVYKGDVFLGHVSGFNAINVFKAVSLPHKCIVSNPITKYNVGVGFEVFFEGSPKEVEPTEEEKTILKLFQKEYFPEYEEACHLVYEEPQKALDLLLPLVNKERGLDVKHMCCRCYRKLKQYELEKEMVENILHYIDNIPDDIAPEDVVLSIRASRELYESRLAYDEKRIANKSARKMK